MKNQTKILLAVIGVLALSSCGRNRFNGTFTGFETSQMGASQATLVLQEDGGAVTGTYTVTGQMGTQTGQLTGSAQDADTLTNVTLVMSATAPAATTNTTTNFPVVGNTMGAMGQGFFTGNLASTNRGRQINGTLNPQNMGMGMGMTQWGNAGMMGNAVGKTLNLTRSGDN
jgi:hypothetical protein